MGISVIIPVRNQSATLERAVKSAFAAGANEVLVFDDASTDNIHEVLMSMAHGDRVRPMWSHFRTGVSYARNQMIHMAQNDWIIPLDADDELLRLPLPLHENEFYYGGWVEHQADGSEETYQANGAKMLDRKPLCHATMMFTKAQWQKAGGYDPDFAYAEDYAFQCALVNAGYAPVMQPYALYRRYIGDNPRTEQAVKYWDFYHQLAKTKYPLVFI